MEKCTPTASCSLIFLGVTLRITINQLNPVDQFSSQSFIHLSLSLVYIYIYIHIFPTSTWYAHCIPIIYPLYTHHIPISGWWHHVPSHELPNPKKRLEGAFEGSQWTRAFGTSLPGVRLVVPDFLVMFGGQNVGILWLWSYYDLCGGFLKSG